MPRIPTIAALTLLACACGTTSATSTVAPALAPDAVLASYDNSGRLLNFPLAEAFGDFAAADRAGRSYTDVYVLAHGWNYTMMESIANTSDWLVEIGAFADRLRARGVGDDAFRPYVVAVSWDSVSRPARAALDSVIPGESNMLAEWLSYLPDTLVFHFFSVWNESVNAMAIAIGRGYPAEYRATLVQNPAFPASGEPNPAAGGEVAPVPAAAAAVGRRYGRIVPVASILRSLAVESARRERRGQPPFAIHVVGHSFGGKLATMATVEALRGWDEALASLDESLPPPRIESLVAFNAALHPAELGYVEHRAERLLSFADRLSAGDAFETLRAVPRRAFVTSRHDYPNGIGFDVSELLLQKDNVQKSNQILTASPPGSVAHNVKAVTGLLALPLVVGWSALEWIGGRVLAIPTDWAYHVARNDTLGEPDGSPLGVARGVFNGVHFFLPLDKLRGARGDRMGLFRHVRPGIGRQSVDEMFAGRGWARRREGLEGLRTEPWPSMRAFLAGEVDWSDDRVRFVDATDVYDGASPVTGAHGDLGNKEELDDGTRRIDHTMRFVLKVTRPDLWARVGG